MDILSILPYVQIILAILLVLLILLQNSEASVGGAFGGSSMTEATTRKRRGSQKILFIFTIGIAILFAVSVMASQFV